MKKHLLAALTLSAAAICLPVQAAVLEGQSFDDIVKIGNQELKLNGLGLRGVLFIKAYVAGLYVPEKSTVGQQIVRQPGPKRIQMRMLREITAPDIKKALVDGMQKNVSESQWAAMQERVAQFSRTIESIGVAKPGDTITLDYVPERGLLLAVNDVAKGNAISGADFYNAVLEIFVGDNPVDGRLKKGMLGQ
jgi:hypothetical protein